MGLRYNPFNGSFDFTRSPASYMDGEVATFADLPLSATAAPLNSAWLVRQASGVYFLARKPAGIYIRTATGGTDRNADYTYASAFPDVFSDANFTVYDDADSTRSMQIQVADNQTLTFKVTGSDNIVRSVAFPLSAILLAALMFASSALAQNIGIVTGTNGTVITGRTNTLTFSNKAVFPAQTADSGTSLMTRVLTDNNPIQTIGTVRPLGAFGFNTAGGGAASANHAFGGADVRSGTNTNGYGRASLYRGLNNNNNFTGGGIRAQNMSCSILVGINETITTNSFVRFIVGSGGFQGAAPLLAPANSNALSTRGFGFEITRTSTTNVFPLPVLRARLFAHDGTNYYTSAYTEDFHSFDYQQQFIVSYTTNGVVTLQMSSSTFAPSRPSATPVLTLTNGPTGTLGGAFIDFATVNRSDIAPATSLHTIYYGGMVEVKN